MIKNVRIERRVKNSNCVEDFVYSNNKLIGTQGNLMSKNRKNSKNYNYFGQVFENVTWEYI